VEIKKTDVIIVGGGIAGLTLAKFLAEEGIDFILFEEHDDFFQKACGEAIHLELADYNFFDLYGSKLGIEREIYNTIMSTRYGKANLYMPMIMGNKYLIEKEFAHQITKYGGIIGDILSGMNAGASY